VEQPIEGMYFAEFGRRLLEIAVTPELIHRSFVESLPGPTTYRLTNPFDVVVDVRAEIGEVTRRAPDHPGRELTFGVEVRIHLRLQIDFTFGLNLAHEEYDALAETELRVRVVVLPPLTLFADIDPVAPYHVRVTSEGKNLFDVAKRLTGLDGEIRRGVAEGVNEQIALSIRDRTFPLEAQLQAIGDLVPTPRSDARPPHL
jgi:hypothetical protein